MDPIGYRSVVNHLRVLIVVIVLAAGGGLYVAVMTQRAVAHVSDTATETAKVVVGTSETVRTSHELITQFLEQTKQPLVRGAENSDAIREYSAELTRVVQIALQKMDALEQSTDRLEGIAHTSQEQFSEALDILRNPFRNIFKSTSRKRGATAHGE